VDAAWIGKQTADYRALAEGYIPKSLMGDGPPLLIFLKRPHLAVMQSFACLASLLLSPEALN